MLRPAYAVEYDYLPAHQCAATLETKRIAGLFFSGQLNGTTGERRGHVSFVMSMLLLWHCCARMTNWQTGMACSISQHVALHIVLSSQQEAISMISALT